MNFPTNHIRMLPGLALILALAAASSVCSSAVAQAVSPGCQASWTNPAGGSWSTGSNWSTNAPPTPSQNACINIPLTSPVLLIGSGTANSLTVGGGASTDQLTLQSAILDLGANSTVADDGVIGGQGGGSHINLATGATLTNHGSVFTSPGGFFEVAGNLTNAADGFLNVAGTATYGGQSVLYVDGPATLTNYGELAVQANSYINAPEQGTGVVFKNAGGAISNSGTITIASGGTFIQGAGAATGNPVVIQGALNIAGAGASAFALDAGSSVAGTVAKQQSLLLSSNYTYPVQVIGSLTNQGTIATVNYATVAIPAGHTLVNDGTIVTRPGLSLEIEGNVTNAPTGTVAVAGTATYGGGSELQFDAPGTFTNQGTVSVQANSTVYAPYRGTSGGVFDNAGGTVQNAGTVSINPGAAFVEGAGATSGNPIDLPGGDLSLTGSGAASFLITGTVSNISGNIAKAQTVEVAGPLGSGQVTAAASFTNSGTFVAHAAEINLRPETRSPTMALSVCSLGPVSR